MERAFSGNVLYAVMNGKPLLPTEVKEKDVLFVEEKSVTNHEANII